MTFDQSLALSLDPALPRASLTDRLRCDDPELLESARRLLYEARAVRDRVAAQGLRFLPWNAPEYPVSLLAIPDTPPGLWYRGTLNCLSAPLVAIVGSRAGSATALHTADQLAGDLAAAGVTVVSGLARGVDSAAHRGALRTGRTVAVLGSGVDRPYPAEHRRLADHVAGGGLVVSEYPPGTQPLPFHFPARNRIISGLSRAVIVIEAARESGSLITARCALDQGREVMVVPGNVLTGRNTGGHALIRDGARIVESADDVLTELGLGRRDPLSAHQSAGSKDAVLAKMDRGHAYDLDALANATGVDVARLLPRLSTLELAGALRRVDGGRFMRTS